MRQYKDPSGGNAISPIVDESTVEKLYILVQDIAGEGWYDSDAHQKALELIESMM